MLRRLARRKLMSSLVRSREASAFGSAQYLGCDESVPLSQRMAEVEKRLSQLEAKAMENL